MDEPIQTKVSDKDCRTICNSLNQRDKSHRLSNSSSSSGGVSGCGNINGNLESSGNHNSHYSYHKPNPLSFPSNSLGRTLPTGDQNANPVTSTSDSSSNVYCHQPVQNSIQGKYQDYSNNHHQFHHSTLAYGNSLDGDPGGSSRHSQERDSQNNDNTITPIDKGYCVEDDDQDDDDDKPEEYTGTLPAQYILPSVTKYNSCKGTEPNFQCQFDMVVILIYMGSLKFNRSRLLRFALIPVWLKFAHNVILSHQWQVTKNWY